MRFKAAVAKDTYGNAASFLKRTPLSVYRTAVTPSAAGVTVQTVNTKRRYRENVDLEKPPKSRRKIIMAQPSPPSWRFPPPTRSWLPQGPALRQNTIEYKWLGSGKFSMAAWCLRSCRSTGGFGPGDRGPDDF